LDDVAYQFNVSFWSKILWCYQSCQFSMSSWLSAFGYRTLNFFSPLAECWPLFIEDSTVPARLTIFGLGWLDQTECWMYIAKIQNSIVRLENWEGFWWTTCIILHILLVSLMKWFLKKLLNWIISV
jgi:hypothetical protein